MDPIQYQGLLDAIGAVQTALVAIDMSAFIYAMGAMLSAWAFIVGIQVVNS